MHLCWLSPSFPWPFRFDVLVMTAPWPNYGMCVHLLGPDEAYKVKVVVSNAWVVGDRLWVLEVYIIGEGINFTMDVTTKLFQN